MSFIGKTKARVLIPSFQLSNINML